MIRSVRDHDHGQDSVRMRISIGQDISIWAYVSVS